MFVQCPVQTRLAAIVLRHGLELEEPHPGRLAMPGERGGRRHLVAGDDQRPPDELLAAVDHPREVEADLRIEQRRRTSARLA